MHKFTLNDNDREEWVSNDEGLLAWRKSCPTLSMRQFVRANRAELDEAILSVLNRQPG